MWLGVFLFIIGVSGCLGVWHEDVGPWVNATKGELFPRARERQVSEDFLLVQPWNLQFSIKGNSCYILEEALGRYKTIIANDGFVAVKTAVRPPGTFVRQSPMLRGVLKKLRINLENPCESLPHVDMDEQYDLRIDYNTSASDGSGELTAPHIWGILRGLESFSQLIAASDDGHLTIKCQKILDSPRFPHRGLLLDTSRHYFPVSDILLTLDAMSYNKLNVFHWHIVDDNSFPYVSKTFPKLSEKGAYHPTMVYRPSDVQRVIAYARLRGIRVIAEFDSPAHTKSWGLAHPEILTECYEKGKPNGKFGPMNPLKRDLWLLLDNFFTEIFETFPDRYTHLGGDEIDFSCWASNPTIIDYMQANGFPNDFDALEGQYFEGLLQRTKNRNITSIVWQEVYQHVAKLPAEVAVQIWTGSWQSLMQDVVSKNHSAILSACWYLDHLKSGGDWKDFYLCDPTDFDGTEEMKSRVLGGEACMWGEFVDRTNVHPRIWPRASAAAESLWSHVRETTDEAAKRLEEHSCRMNRRGVPAQPPNGSGFCAV